MEKKNKIRENVILSSWHFIGDVNFMIFHTYSITLIASIFNGQSSQIPWRIKWIFLQFLFQFILHTPKTKKIKYIYFLSEMRNK